MLNNIKYLEGIELIYNLIEFEEGKLL